jgi:hypothetical protein
MLQRRLAAIPLLEVSREGAKEDMEVGQFQAVAAIAEFNAHPTRDVGWD